MSGPPALAGLEDVVSEHVAPGDERNEDDDHDDLTGVVGDGGRDLAAQIQWQSEKGQVNPFPNHLEEEQRDHLHWIAQAQNGREPEATEERKANAVCGGKIGGVIEDGGPDVGAEARGQDEVAETQGVEPDERDLVHAAPRRSRESASS